MAYPPITFDAPLGWARVKTQKPYADIVTGGYTGGYDYPMGWKLTRQPKSGYSYLIYTPSWWNFLISPYINAPNVVLFTGQDGKSSGITVLNKGLFNTKPNVGRGFMDGQPIPAPPWAYPPKAECLTSTGAIHKVLERKNGSTRIETFKLSDPAPDPLVYNHITTPWLLYTFMAITPNDTLSYNWGNMNHIPLISVDGSAWISDEKLEFFKDYPTQSPPEEPMPDTRPLWRDYSRYQGVVNFDVAKLNGVQGVALRAGISWGYKDMNFPDYWTGAKLAGLYRTSYHVIYTDQPIQTQVDNWYAQHPARDIIPRVIDLEVDRGDPPAAKATAVLAMSDAVLARDGVRPIIYTRYQIANDWLASWSDTLKNEHYWWLAQYLFDTTKEHPGPPTLPISVLASSVVLHQTNDKIAGFAGEVESASVDWDRWTLGDETQMREFIAETWGGSGAPPEPPPDGEVDIAQAIQILNNAKESGIATVDSIQTALDILE